MKTRFDRKHASGWWSAFIAVLLLELLGAHVLRGNPDNFEALFGPLADWTGRHAAVVHNFDSMKVNARALNLFFGVTIWLVIPKAVFWYWWLHSNQVTNARYFVITPLTGSVAGGMNEFITATVMDHPNGRPRSMASRLLWSLLELAFAAGTVLILILWGGWSTTPLHMSTSVGFNARVRDVVQMGFGLWLPWSVFLTGICSFLLAIAAAVVRDSVRAIRLFILSAHDSAPIQRNSGSPGDSKAKE